jgi:putative ATP-binding cassette transporter
LSPCQDYRLKKAQEMFTNTPKDNSVKSDITINHESELPETHQSLEGISHQEMKLLTN